MVLDPVITLFYWNGLMCKCVSLAFLNNVIMQNNQVQFSKLLINYKSVFISQCEALQQENEQLKEKIEELTVDLQLMKEEIATAGKFLMLNINRTLTRTRVQYGSIPGYATCQDDQ